MAKTNKSLKLAKKSHKMKDCCVKLKRLSPETIKELVENQTTTYNISAKIKNNTMEISDTKISSSDNSINTFYVDVKISAGLISIDASKKMEIPVSKRNLRPKTASLRKSLKPSRKSCLILAKPHQKPITKLIDDAWKQCKKDNANFKQNIRVNDVVMAKLKGHPAWPAMIIEIVNKTKVKVRFFGADQNELFGFVNTSELTPIAKSLDLIRLTLKRNMPKFNRAVTELERIYVIPSSVSMMSLNIL